MIINNQTATLHGRLKAPHRLTIMALACTVQSRDNV